MEHSVLLSKLIAVYSKKEEWLKYFDCYESFTPTFCYFEHFPKTTDFFFLHIEKNKIKRINAVVLNIISSNYQNRTTEISKNTFVRFS